MPRIITLTTDFGLADGYAGVMKGVILGIDPTANIVDLTHLVPPQDVPHGAFVLGSTFRYFPAESIHVCIVDPGVGTGRKPVLLDTPGGRFLAPDNGVLGFVLHEFADDDPPAGGTEAGPLEPVEVQVPASCSAYELDREEYWLPDVSSTFHGRDIFAPVAAQLCRGARPEDLGTRIDLMTDLAIPRPVKQADALVGCVIHVDRFGNLVTNLRSDDLPHRVSSVGIGGSRIPGLSPSYEGGGGLAAIIASHGYLEVAVPGGSAAALLEAGRGAEVTVE